MVKRLIKKPDKTLKFTTFNRKSENDPHLNNKTFH